MNFYTGGQHSNETLCPKPFCVSGRKNHSENLLGPDKSLNPKTLCVQFVETLLLVSKLIDLSFSGFSITEDIHSHRYISNPLVTEQRTGL